MNEEANFKIRGDQIYWTPITMNEPAPFVEYHRQPIMYYKDNARYCVCYRTDNALLAKVLPPGFSPMEESLIQVNYSVSRAIPYMAGRSYHMVGVDALVRFDGEVDHLEGYFGFAVWMDKFMPMVGGREMMGAAKIMGDVEFRDYNNKYTFTMSEEGSLLIEGSVWNLNELTKEQIEKRLAAGGDRQWLGWKYIPNVTSTGYDISKPTIMPVRRDVKRMWICEGKVKYNETLWENAPFSAPIVNNLIKLPILEYVDAYVQEDSCEYLFREHRVLK
ncbi:MAG: acetoacetate decarboxylase family protein [Bacteroidales bacterium]|jgi:acetoacetate decarboxylase|nr:acetoacetate decarboxylase family protein [Bacteroidales bacterium]